MVIEPTRFGSFRGFWMHARISAPGDTGSRSQYSRSLKQLPTLRLGFLILIVVVYIEASSDYQYYG